MAKQAISVTLDRDNLTWLKAQTVVSGARSLSEALDRLLRKARRSSHLAGPPRSVRGTIQIDESDPGLEAADAAVRAVFGRSLARRFQGSHGLRPRAGRRRPGPPRG